MKKQLVLHICCAPDEAWVVKCLRSQYDLYSFFCNPNIQPEGEYKKRLEEAERVAKIFNVPISADHYEPDLWEKAIKRLEHTPEGGARCEQCFLLRLRRTANFCKELKWSKFTTVMSISPHKRIAMLNSAGEQAAQEYKLTYEKFDFKKNNGSLSSMHLSKELGLYRQDYCGCLLSKRERDERLMRRREEREKGRVGEEERNKV